jgi:transcriptional regulator with GAF, ATPase, and Fis domain
MSSLDEVLLGESAGIRAVRSQLTRLVDRVQKTNRLPLILIQGETGTGKGLVGRLIHQFGPS